MSIFDIDILSPIDEIVGRALQGKMHRFTFDTKSGFTGYTVEKLLRKYGVRVWGRRSNGTKRSFLVKDRQATWAEYVMCRAGIPIVDGLVDSRNLEYPDRHPDGSMPESWTEQGVPAISLIDHIGELFARFLA